MFLIILSKLKSRDGILGSPQPRESFTRNLHRFPQPSLDEIRSLSISEQENGADNLKKHSNVLVLEVGSPSKYTVDTVRVLPFFLTGSFSDIWICPLSAVIFLFVLLRHIIKQYYCDWIIHLVLYTSFLLITVTMRFMLRRTEKKRCFIFWNRKRLTLKTCENCNWDVCCQ